MFDRTVGVRDNFVASHFLRVIIDGEANDQAEDEFARIEDLALPVVRALEPFATRSDVQLRALKATMAMLWSRSFSREVVSQRAHRQTLEEFGQSTPSNARAIELFRKWNKRDPEAGEIESAVELAAARLLRDRLHDVNSMLNYHNGAVGKFEPLHVSLYRPIRGCEFITSDNPVLLAWTNELIQVGAQNGVALGDASFIFLPVSRFVAACLTLRPEPDGELDRLQVIRINQAMWRNAVERIACHPSLDEWPAACNVRRPTPPT